MAELTVERGKTALLIMDCQNDIVAAFLMAEEQHLLEKAQRVLEEVHKVGLPVIYVVVQFREGHPEVSPLNRTFSGIKQSGRLQEGTPGAQIHPQVAPQPGDVVVVKRRVNAFFNTDLATILKAKGIETLVLMGIATSGVILSTVRYAADADYQLVVLEDCCADRDSETHSFLMDKILSRQATVTSSEAFLQALSLG